MLLVKSLEYEQFNSSALSSFLLRRCLSSVSLGVRLFWLVKGMTSSNRVTSLALKYVYLCPVSHLQVIFKQTEFNSIMHGLHEHIIISTRHPHRSDRLKEILRHSKYSLLPDFFQCTQDLENIKPEECFVFDSKRLPIAIRANSYGLIFSEGKDLHPHMLFYCISKAITRVRNNIKLLVLLIHTQHN